LFSFFLGQARQEKVKEKVTKIGYQMLGAVAKVWS